MLVSVELEIKRKVTGQTVEWDPEKVSQKALRI
jgi:hypothetical protein